jgi:alkylhydroperoxidase family enzyme
LAVNDKDAIAALLGGDSGNVPAECGTAGRANAQLRLAALVAMQAAAASYQWEVNNALAAGVTESEIVDVLCTVAPVTGAARVHSAAAALAEVLGCESES